MATLAQDSCLLWRQKHFPTIIFFTPIAAKEERKLKAEEEKIVGGGKKEKTFGSRSKKS